MRDVGHEIRIHRNAIDTNRRCIPLHEQAAVLHRAAAVEWVKVYHGEQNNEAYQATVLAHNATERAKFEEETSKTWYRTPRYVTEPSSRALQYVKDPWMKQPERAVSLVFRIYAATIRCHMDAMTAHRKRVTYHETKMQKSMEKLRKLES